MTSSILPLAPIFRILVVLNAFGVVLSDTETLLNGPLPGWKFNGGAVTGQIANWHHTSGTNHYSVCDVFATTREPTNWLRTDYIDTKDAKRVDIKIVYTTRKCQSSIVKYKYCKENFKLYMYHSTSKEPPPDPVGGTFQIIATANPTKVPDYRPDGAKDYNTMNVALVPKKQGMYLAFYDQGACLALINILVTFNYCPTQGGVLVNFVRTVSSFDDSNQSLVEGTCVSKYSENITALTAVCTSRGNWNLSSEVKCLCKPGYEYILAANDCKGCKQDKYKTLRSNTLCQSCPNKSQPNTKRTKCDCSKDYYRLLQDSSSVPCRALPDGPSLANATAWNTSMIILNWTPPGQSNYNITFTLDCFKCTDPEDTKCVVQCGKEVIFSPGKRNLKVTNASVSGLVPGTSYMFKVYSVIDLNAAADVDKWKHVKAFATTRKGSVEPPAIDGGTSDAQIKKFVLIIGVPVIALIILIIIVCGVFMWKRQKKLLKVPTDVKFANGEVDLPTCGQRLYIDPSNYNDPEEALRNFAKELDKRTISLEKIIGGGEFGDVYKGTLKRHGETQIPVAVKSLKKGSSRKNREDFLFEASIMGQFCDPNVIYLEGVVTTTVPLMIITEFMSNGSLDNFLKKMDSKLSMIQLMGMARGVSSGMNFLANMNFVHRDLAGRNILVTETLVCKVADFGLSRELEDSAYETKGGKIPVRWTAPEAIKYRKFSPSSDVWSYGILLWEIFSFAERPYWDWSNFEVMDRVESGYRLPPPMNCPKVIHQIMLDCWHTDRLKRPKFDDIVKKLDTLIRSPEKLKDNLPKVPPKPNMNYTEVTTIEQWLNSIKMGQYSDSFQEAGYGNLKNIAEFEEPDLEILGVKLIGHKNKIRKSIRDVKDKLKRQSSLPV